MVEFLVIFFCIFANAILALIEMAFVAVSKSRLRDLAREGSQAAARLLHLRDTPERTLSVLQIGISLLSALAAATGGASIDKFIGPFLQSQLGLGEGASEILGILLVVLPLTYLTVVVGELLPKTLALRNPAIISLKSAKWLAVSERFLMPLVNMLEWSTKKLLDLFFGRTKPEVEVAEDALQIGHLSVPHRQYILNLVNLENKRIRDVYVPLAKVIHVTTKNNMEEIQVVFTDSGYTRLPVFQEGQVIGILHFKEFTVLKNAQRTDWTKIINSAPKAQLQDALLPVLRAIQEKKVQMAIVYKQEEPMGIVTLEDIVEEIIGDVFDEYEADALKRVLGTGSTLRSPPALKK